MKSLLVLALFLLAGCPRSLPPPSIAAAVTDAPAEYVVIGPAEPVLFVGDTIQIGAMTVRQGMSISCAPAWRSANPEVATITPDGRLIGRAPGSTSILATCGAFTAAATVSVPLR
jgi:hypothetical protein